MVRKALKLGEKADKLKRKRLQGSCFIKIGMAVLGVVVLLLMMLGVKIESSSFKNKESRSISGDATNLREPKEEKNSLPTQKSSRGETVQEPRQSQMADSILRQININTVQQKFCIDKADDNTSFVWFGQGDGTLPMGHVTTGIEKNIGDHIATILSAESDKSKFMVDVGMNSGYFGVMSASLGFPVLAFDPQPACHAFMKKTIDANPGFPNNIIEAFLMGLGTGGSDIEMHVSVCHGGYSWPDKWGQKGDPLVVKVPVRSLSEVIGDRHVSVMKMDTEGNEMSILNSGVDIFERGQVDYLLVEVKPFVWKERSVDTANMDILEKLAVSILRIDNGTEKQKGEPFREGDYLFTFIDKPVSNMRRVAFKMC